MKIQNFHRAEIHPDKITKYLLDKEHVDGGDKADRFDGLGFRIEKWEELAQALRIHGADNEIVSSENTGYGVKYIVDGWIETPAGKALYVRVIWQIDKGTEHPRLISAYPFRW